MEGFYALVYHEIIKREDFDINNPSHIRVKQDYDDILPSSLFAYLDEFEKQMKYLYDNGYKTIKLEDVVDYYYKGKALPEKAVLLTFDDMYKSVYKYAYPILKEYNFNAVGFVVLDWLFDEEHEYSPSFSVCMSKGELNEIRDVFEFANHTRALHTRSGGQTAVLTVDKETFAEDVKACEEFLDVKGVFAYPFRGYNDVVISRLKELGFRLAFTANPGLNSINTNPFELHRNLVFIDTDFDKFVEMLER